ncbi:Aldo/keto reductase [Trametes punicea]|nr:Aldo/keto reductase [Trametes punicea]
MAPKMEYVRLGNSGLKVSKIILGCMSYGDPRWSGWILGEEDAIEHIKFAYDHGITTFDTANVSSWTYSNGLSEIILGNAIRKLSLPREELVIMTKLYRPIPVDTGIVVVGKDPLDLGIVNQYGLNRKHIFDSVKASVKKLPLDYIDVLQCHWFDYNTPIEETVLSPGWLSRYPAHSGFRIAQMQALHDVVKAGYVRYIGMSSCYAYQFHQMQQEREMFPTLKLFGVASIPWSPLARGVLTSHTTEETKRTQTDGFIAYYKKYALGDIVNRVEEIAKKKRVGMAQVSLAWVMSKPGVTAPIIGTTSLENLEDILGALDVKLTEEEINYLEEPYKPMPIADLY